MLLYFRSAVQVIPLSLIAVIGLLVSFAVLAIAIKAGQVEDYTGEKDID